MELVVVGAGPAYTNRRAAAASSYLVRSGGADGAGLLLDLGQGSFANLGALMSPREPSQLTAVLISHLHPDHCIDLIPLRHYLRYEFEPRRRMRVLAPAGLADRLDALDGHEGFSAASLDVERLAEGSRTIGPFEVEAPKVTHTDESYAFRVALAPAGSAPAGSSAPAGLVYSGDCARWEDLGPLIRPGDTLLAEASFGPGPLPEGAQHLTSPDAARAAAAGKAARLLITHVQIGFSRAATLAAAEAVFGGTIQLVTEGDRFEI